MGLLFGKKRGTDVEVKRNEAGNMNREEKDYMNCKENRSMNHSMNCKENRSMNPGMMQERSENTEHMVPVDVAEQTMAGSETGKVKTEPYDRTRMTDVFENYNEVRQGLTRVPVHFVETRKYLQQVRDQKHSIQLLENRIKYRKDAGLDTSWHEEELEGARKELKLIIAEVAEEISKLENINQKVVMTKRYIEGMTWDEVAESADFSMHTVQKSHGNALPRMEQILLDDGPIEPVEAYDPED